MPRTYSYKLKCPATDWHHTVAFWWIRRTGKIHLHLTDSEGGENPCRRHLYRAEIQWSNEVWRREEKKQKKGMLNWSLFLRSRVPKLYWPISSASESRTSIPPYLHSQIHPASSVPSSTVLVVHISAWFLVGIIRVVELPLMTWHRWELLLPASFIVIGKHQSYTSIASCVVASHSSTSNT